MYSTECDVTRRGCSVRYIGYVLALYLKQVLQERRVSDNTTLARVAWVPVDPRQLSQECHGLLPAGQDDF
jgi:hypothetical protein